MYTHYIYYVSAWDEPFSCIHVLEECSPDYHFTAAGKVEFHFLCFKNQRKNYKYLLKNQLYEELARKTLYSKNEEQYAKGHLTHDKHLVDQASSMTFLLPPHFLSTLCTHFLSFLFYKEDGGQAIKSQENGGGGL